MKIGKLEEREVSDLNHELFNKAKEILESAPDKPNHTTSHIGWSGVGDFIDWLEANYEITPKDTGVRKDIVRQLIKFTKNKDESYTVWILQAGHRLVTSGIQGVIFNEAIPLGHCRDEESFKALLAFFQAHDHDITIQECPMGEVP